MPFCFPHRFLRIKTLLLAIPIIIILSYFSFQGRQFPESPSYVPSFHPIYSSTHAFDVSEQAHQSDGISTRPSSEHPTSDNPTTSVPSYTPIHTENAAIPQNSQTQINPSRPKKPLTYEGPASKSLSNDEPPNWKNSSMNSNSTSPGQNVSHANDLSFHEKQIEFWRSFEPLLALSQPDCKSPKRLGQAGAQSFRPSDKLVRPDLLEMPKESVKRMRTAHTKFVNGMREKRPQMAFTAGTRGLVSTAGGEYLPVFVISLRMLRRTGTTLPVEVFLADHEEYEEYICTKVLPSLNATCVIMSDILDSVPHSMEIAHYQFKVFAMMFSSFEEILLLDADCFPIHNPEQLFTSEVFQKHGLITWPDFWASSTSTLFYEIASQSVPPMTERASSEAGELLLSKKTHQKSLLLATYYNYYGSSHYFPLLSQGAPGEGDKETFLAAANILNESFYATSESVQAIGHVQNDGEIAGSAMVQYDPVQDYNLTQQGLWRIKDLSVAESPRPFFVHAHFPKFNPATIFKQGGPTKDSNGKDRLAWTDDAKTIKGFGIDLERQFWEEIKWTSCELEGKFKTWQNNQWTCKNATSYWNNIYGRTRIRRALSTLAKEQ